MNKVTTAAEAVSKVKDGDVLLIGGFLQSGSPETLLKALLETQAKDLTFVSNDTGTKDTTHIQIMRQGRVKKVFASYVGANAETGNMLLNDPESVTLVPQGTLAEKIRAAGAGIKGFYTEVGAGTVVAEGKEARCFDGRECLLELALHGNVAFIRASVADQAGNCHMRGSTKSFNAIMAQAADYAVVEAVKIVEPGELDPELVTVPGIFIDAVVQAV